MDAHISQAYSKILGEKRNKLKFLVESIPTTGPVPPEIRKAIADALEASVPILKKLHQEGKMESMYMFPKGGGGGILNVESTEELTQILLSVPIMGFGAIDCRLISDFESTAQILIKSFRG